MTICVYAQVGKWDGKLSVSPQMQLRLSIIIEGEPEAYSAKFISVDQGNAVIEGNSTVVDGNKISINFTTIGASYDAIISSDSLDGTFIQNGQRFPLILMRTENNTEDKSNRPQTPYPPYPYSDEEVEFVNAIDGNTLSGTLTTPKNQVVKTAVILVSGSGPQNRDEELFGHKPFLVLADHLSRHGIAVLRYDDRGVGKSSSLDKIGTTADLAYDAEAALKYLRDNYNFENVGIIGHSEGGLIAFMLAGEEAYDTPDFIISLAGPGIRGADVLIGQQELALINMGVPKTTIEETKELNKALYSIILESTNNDDELSAKLKERMLSSIPGGMDMTSMQSQINIAINQITEPWMYNFIKYDPFESIKNTKCPVLAINGGLDAQVIADENLSAIEFALKLGGNNDYKIVKLEKLNHLLQPAITGAVDEYATITTTIDKTALSTISEWLKVEKF